MAILIIGYFKMECKNRHYILIYQEKTQRLKFNDQNHALKAKTNEPGSLKIAFAS
jgi:hypothetical protein